MNWQPSATRDTLQQRAKAMADIRAFFNGRGYLEVETPVLGRYGVTDAYLSNIKARVQGVPYCLQTSPEYHMKRLLAAGSGSIFQLARVFRDDELGRWHNPEFTLLEWYQLEIDHHALMDEMDCFLQTLLACPPLIRKTYQQAFLEICGIDPLQACLDELQACVSRFGLGDVLGEETDRDLYLFLLMSHVVEAALAKEKAPVAVFHFPVSQAALAKVNQGVAERFEIYYQGVELANGFHELTDVHAQTGRFQQDNHLRKQRGFPVVEPDCHLLAALEYGLPACSGVALGVDRLLALKFEKTAVADVLSFDFSIA